MKKYKDNKKDREKIIMNIINELGMDSGKIDIRDDNNNIRSRVYKHTSTTKGSIKEEVIESALLEVLKDKKQVAQLIKKIDSKRPINTRYYLKRTKGNGQQNK